MAEQAYTIDIPGLSDVIRLPIESLDNKELRRQRAQRFKSKVPPIPAFLSWVPDMINKLDDCEDVLSVGLTLAKPLLRHVAPRFVPGLGWILLGLDIVNLTTALLGLAASGPTSKRVTRQVMDLAETNGRRRATNVAQWLNRTNWLGFALQAGQVLDTFTGYGLQLGPIMGGLSDVFWGSIRAIGGAQVKFRGPPEADPLAKAARAISQASSILALPDFYDREDLEIAIAARNVAADILTNPQDPTILDARSDELAQVQMPQFYSWNPASREALREEGLDPDASTEAGQFPGDPIMTYRQTMQSRASFHSFSAITTYNLLGKSDRSAGFGFVYNEAGRHFWEYTSGNPKNLTYEPQNWQDAALRGIENNVFPPPNTPGRIVRDWGNKAHQLATEEGFAHAKLKHLKSAATLIMGGYVEH